MLTLTSGIAKYLIEINEQDLDIPTLYMMGDQDYVFLEPVRQLIKKQPHSQLVILDDCGHVCNVDQATAFNSLTTQFLFNKEQRLVS